MKWLVLGLILINLAWADEAAVNRGLNHYQTYCASCHTLKYTQYANFGVDFYKTSMPETDSKNWFGLVPPDLTLKVREKGADWVYQYLISFYTDPTRLFGVNNLVKPNVSMPHVMNTQQGEKILMNGRLQLIRTGTMTEHQFEHAMQDIVSFLSHVADPRQAQRKAMGWKVFIFLLFALIVSYLLKQVYWRDIK